MQDTVQSITYRGFEIYLSDPKRQLVCSYMVAKLRFPCRDFAHGKEIVDAHLAKATQPLKPGEVRILAADVRVTNSISASTCRYRSERARNQNRKGGKFAKEVRL